MHMSIMDLFQRHANSSEVVFIEYMPYFTLLGSTPFQNTI